MATSRFWLIDSYFDGILGVVVGADSPVTKLNESIELCFRLRIESIGFAQ